MAIESPIAQVLGGWIFPVREFEQQFDERKTAKRVFRPFVWGHVDHVLLGLEVERKKVYWLEQFGIQNFAELKITTFIQEQTFIKGSHHFSRAITW